MDIQAYIASGILESYLLGDLTPQEEAEVEQFAEQHPEIREELDRIELALEKYAQMAAIPPPAGSLSAVLEQLPEKSGEGAAPNRAISGRTLSIFGFGLAAIGLIAAFLFYQQQQRMENDLRETRDTLQALQADCDEVQASNEQLSRSLDILLQGETQRIDMQGTDLAPQAIARVFVNTESQIALLDAGSLPPPPSDKTYQLWALIDGNPVDMGIFDLTIDGAGLVEVPYISGAQAFAVTLEDAGGNPTPNLDQLYVIGNV